MGLGTLGVHRRFQTGHMDVAEVVYAISCQNGLKMKIECLDMPNMLWSDDWFTFSEMRDEK